MRNDLSLTAQNQGYYKVYVSGQEGPISQHSTEREAIESAVDHLMNNPEDEVYFSHEYLVDVTLDMDRPTATEPEGDEGQENDPAPKPPQPPKEEEPVDEESDFIQVQGDKLYLSGEPYHFGGTNGYYLPNYQGINEKVVDNAFDAFEQAGIRTVRMWAFYDGQPQYSNDKSIQPEPYEYNEQSLQYLDQVIAKGKEKGMTFILPFINYWNELGGVPQYNEWFGKNQGMHSFMTTPEIQNCFKAYIEMLLNRVNTVTGVAYKDEPAILAWEIGNEIRNHDEGQGESNVERAERLRDWYREIARFIKGIDTNHLVATGEEGYDISTNGYSADQYSNTYPIRAGVGSSYKLNSAIEEIDLCSFHWYPDVFGIGHQVNQDVLTAQTAWIKDHVANASGKPVFLGEYGIPSWGDNNQKITMYGGIFDLFETMQLAGTMLWQLTADGEKCYEYGGNICYPSGRQDENAFKLLQDHCQNMKNL